MAGFPQATVVATAAEVQCAYDKLAAALQVTVDSDDCVLLGIMLGGMLPTARLAAMLHGDYRLDCCQVSRYRGAEQGGALEWLQPPRTELRDRTVLLVDDIFDEGITLDFVTRKCFQFGARHVVSSVLVRKKRVRGVTGMPPDHIGLEVADRYVFGCGMDFRHRWRHLPDIWALADES